MNIGLCVPTQFYSFIIPHGLPLQSEGPHAAACSAIINPPPASLSPVSPDAFTPLHASAASTPDSSLCTWSLL